MHQKVMGNLLDPSISLNRVSNIFEPPPPPPSKISTYFLWIPNKGTCLRIFSILRSKIVGFVVAILSYNFGQYPRRPTIIWTGPNSIWTNPYMWTSTYNMYYVDESIWIGPYNMWTSPYNGRSSWILPNLKLF